eukprot:8949788-Pyramimonas_sp.AAC.1
MERRPTENKELKLARRHAVMQRRAQRKVKADYLTQDPRRRPATTHDLAKLRRGRGWRCKCCNQSVTPATAPTSIKEWFEQKCGGPPPAAG